MQRKLKKELSLFTATLYGIGIILGAGIYVLIGQGAAIAGSAIWLSFVIAAFIAAFTGLSYAELSGMFPKDAAEYVYTKKAFDSSILAFLVQWIMIFALIVSAATVALGFGNYFHNIFGIEPIIAAFFLIVFLSVVNYIGIKESARFSIFSTLVEMLGLIIVIVIGVFFFGRANEDIFSMPYGFTGVLSATALIFFAYIGFEEIVNMSEETKNAKKTIPRALILSVGISTVLYILVAISSVSVLGSEALANSPAPMSSVVEVAIPKASVIMSVIALFATANTVLAMLIAVSRMLYGMGNAGIIPKTAAKIGKRKTPYFSVFFVMFVSLGCLLVGGIKTVASLTDLGLFIVYIFINASLIYLRYRKPKIKSTFKSPINVGRFPVLALLGIISSGLMIMHFEPFIILYQIIIIMAGFFAYKIFEAHKKRGKML